MSECMLVRIILAVNIPLAIYNADWYNIGNAPGFDDVGMWLVRLFIASAIIIALASTWLLVKLSGDIAVITLRLGATLLAFGNLDLLRQAIWWMQDDGKPYVGFALQAAAWIVWLAVILALDVPRRPLTGDAARS